MTETQAAAEAEPELAEQLAGPGRQLAGLEQDLAGLADQLATLLQALWRAVEHATRSFEQLPSLPEAQAEILRKLVAAGPSSPTQLAAGLDLARPTVSNLVRDLTAGGWLERSPSATDGRSVLLSPADRAREVLEAFDRGRAEVLARALAETPAKDRAELAEAMPALRRLLERLQAMAETRHEKGTSA